MKYEEAIKAWGTMKLREQLSRLNRIEKIENVKVEFKFDEGNPCCAGLDPNCYCSLAEDPNAEILITGNGIRKSGTQCSLSRGISLNTGLFGNNIISFADLIKELCEVGKGNLSL